MSSVQAASLIPFDVRWLDIVLPPLLIATSLLLHTLWNEDEPVSAADDDAHVYRAKTAHARFIPAESKHAFSYPVLYLGLDLDKLERRQLDLGRLFAYAPNERSVTSIHPSGYMQMGGTVKQGIKSRLVSYLVERGVDSTDAERVYTVTMPAYLTLEGINPLTTHFCYDASRQLKAVVLEVHNTFEERHLYILRTGIDEDAKSAVGYEHQWTFARSFHVSPFNDRSGYYTVSVVDPLKTGILDVRILTLTSSHEKKLYAALRGTAVPLSRSYLLRSVARQPFALLLTTPRILYEAFKLHFKKRLDVYPRPEPFVGDSIGSDNEPGREGAVGSVGWQDDAEIDRVAQRAVLRFLQERVDDVANREGRSVQVVLRPANTARPTQTIEAKAKADLPVELLEVFYLTPAFFTDLLVAPSVELALEMGSHAMRRWRTTNDDLFLSLFVVDVASSVDQSGALSEAQEQRRRFMDWSTSFAQSPIESSIPLRIPANHLLDAYVDEPVTKVLKGYFRSVKLGYWIFKATGARFVSGTENWSEWARWTAKKQGKEWHIASDASGSVLHS